MSIAVANATSSAYNEPSKSETLFPDYIREGSYEIVRMIRLYYEYLNSKDNPSYELNNLVLNHDIDEMSDKYLTAIQLQIAKSVPNSVSLDKRRLLKLIAQYYKTRGSEASISSFFRIFYNEIVSVFYPSSYLFNTSGSQSETSSRFRLQDNNYWQKFSYEIRTVNDPELWRNSFTKFVHPAGLKLFVAVLILCFSDNDWDGMSYEEYWNNLDLTKIIGKHSPKWQEGINLGSPYFFYDEEGNVTDVEYDQTEYDYLFKVIIDSVYQYRTETYRIPSVTDSDLFAAALHILIDISTVNYGSSAIFRNNYQSWLKFFDGVRINDGYLDMTIEDAMTNYDPMNACRFEAVSSALGYHPGYLESAISTDGGDINTLTDWTTGSVGEEILTSYSEETLLRNRSGVLPDITI